jgi:hypothetical protein
MPTHLHPQMADGKASQIAVALLCGCLIQIGCSHDDVPELRASAFPVEVNGNTVAEMDQQFGAGKSIAFNALPAPFQKTVSGRNGTYRQWKKTDGPTTTIVYAEIKDGKIGDSYMNQKWGE